MTEQQLTRLIEICQLSQLELADWLHRFLLSYYPIGDIEYHADAYVYAKGRMPVMLVAHLDTVHEQLPQQIDYDSVRQTLKAEEGIGGDDRCGVFAMVSLVERGYMPHVLFTFDEEIGCLGAEIAAQRLCPEVNFLIEIDRMGRGQAVYYDCTNEAFMEVIESFGFVRERGSSSDIAVLAPQFGVAAVNVSAGYMNEHRHDEEIDCKALLETVDKVEQILTSDWIHTRFDYDPCLVMDGYGDRQCVACLEYFSPEELSASDCLCQTCCERLGRDFE